MSDRSQIMSMPYIQPAQAQKHVTHNEALRQLDAVVQLSVEEGPLATPPAIPQAGSRYLVGAGATGDWAGQDGNVAIRDAGGAWWFVEPVEGWRADIRSTGMALRFDGTGWESPAIGPLQNLDHLGVNASADGTNRLSVAADATLLTHNGAGHQVKVNKDSAGDTASLLFQTGFSGRAEMGLAGGDDFSIKVSPDGSSFKPALVADADTGAVQFPSGKNYFTDVFISDDTAYGFDIPFSDPARILMWLAVNLPGRYYMFSITGTLVGGGNFGSMFANPPGSINFMSGALSGTTGPDGAINVSIDNSTSPKRMYLENRLGSNRLFTLATMGK